MTSQQNHFFFLPISPHTPARRGLGASHRPTSSKGRAPTLRFKGDTTCHLPREKNMSIHVERPSPGIVTVTIDSPSTANAITQQMLVRLAGAFGALAQDETVRAVVLTGTGRKAFSTGINLGDAEKVFKMDENDRDKDVVHQMERCPFPVIGAINGFAINAGFEMALACDVLLASPNAKFIDTHAKLGIIPSWGLSQKLPRIVAWDLKRKLQVSQPFIHSPAHPHDPYKCFFLPVHLYPSPQGANVARRVSLTCHPMSAEEALRHGLVNEIIAEDEGPPAAHGGGDGGGGDDVNPRLLAAAMAMARRVVALPRSGVEGYKRCMRDGLALPYGEARTEERRRAFEQYRALPESFFARMKAAAGGDLKQLPACPIVHSSLLCKKKTLTYLA